MSAVWEGQNLAPGTTLHGGRRALTTDVLCAWRPSRTATRPPRPGHTRLHQPQRPAAALCENNRRGLPAAFAVAAEFAECESGDFPFPFPTRVSSFASFVTTFHVCPPPFRALL